MTAPLLTSNQTACDPCQNGLVTNSDHASQPLPLMMGLDARAVDAWKLAWSGDQPVQPSTYYQGNAGQTKIKPEIPSLINSYQRQVGAFNDKGQYKADVSTSEMSTGLNQEADQAIPTMQTLRRPIVDQQGNVANQISPDKPGNDPYTVHASADRDLPPTIQDLQRTYWQTHENTDQKNVKVLNLDVDTPVLRTNHASEKSSDADSGLTVQPTMAKPVRESDDQVVQADFIQSSANEVEKTQDIKQPTPVNKTHSEHADPFQEPGGTQRHLTERSSSSMIKEELLVEGVPPVLLSVGLPVTNSVDHSTTMAHATIVNEVELSHLLQQFCLSIYANPHSMAAGMNNVVLDVGNVLPGTLIEITRQGGALSIKLHTSDEETLRVVRRDKDKLSESLTLTGQNVVRVEAIYREKNQHGSA